MKDTELEISKKKVGVAPTTLLYIKSTPMDRQPHDSSDFASWLDF